MSTTIQHHWFRQHNFFLLLGGLLILLVAGPVSRDFLGHSSITLTNLTLATTLILGVWSLHDSRTWFLVGVGLMIAGIAGALAAIVMQSEIFSLITLFLMLVFLLMSIGIAARQIVSANSIDGNEIAGAVCIYLLLGVIWALLYLFLDVFLEGAFSGVVAIGVAAKLGEFTYYSFVTLTTLGYGDITPVSSTAHSLAFLEAIIGQLYIAILVAGLVGVHIARKITG